MDTWAEVVKARTRLIDELEPLDDATWETPTLCEGWRVKDVVGHLAGTAHATKRRIILDVLKAGFRINKAIDDEACRYGALPREDLVKTYRDGIDSRLLPPAVNATGLLADVVIHTRDVGRVLGIDTPVDAEVQVTLLDYLKNQRFFKMPSRRKGLRLAATDVEWAEGEGPEVRGTGEALMMVMSGRKTALDDLEGDGVATLRQRMGA